MKNRGLHFRVKSLAYESKALRGDERRVISLARNHKELAKKAEQEHQTSNPDFDYSEDFYNRYQNLRHRRTHLLRKETRNTLLAYGFLNGLEYHNIELDSYSEPDWDEVEKTILRFTEEADTAEFRQRLEHWLQEAKGVQDEPQKPQKVA